MQALPQQIWPSGHLETHIDREGSQRSQPRQVVQTLPQQVRPAGQASAQAPLRQRWHPLQRGMQTPPQHS
jgi:hypothetical protein